jgi:hypothetical protein
MIDQIVNKRRRCLQIFFSLNRDDAKALRIAAKNISLRLGVFAVKKELKYKS